MKVREVLDHFISRCEGVDPEKTVDRVIVGDPEADFDRCLVTWMPSMDALRQVVERGYQFLICHEPTFWNHVEDHATEEASDSQEKLAFIEEHGIVIARNHDCWDLWPDVGIPFAWADFLGLGTQPEEIDAAGYQHRYDREPVTLGEFAREVADRCARIGEPFVQVSGDPTQDVSRIGIGTGCACDIPCYRKMNRDCSVVCDDGSVYWSNIQRAKDSDHPIIRVNHGTSEEPGMVTMVNYINAHIDGLEAEHLPHGSCFSLVGTV